MKKVLLLVLSVAVVMSASASFGQGADAIMLYTDQIGPACDLSAGVGVVHVFAVHAFMPGATACQFALNDQSGYTFVAGTVLHQVSVGGADKRNGVAVTYDGGCLAGPVAVVDFVFIASSLEPACGTITVIPDPIAASGRIEGVNCLFQSTFPNGSVFTVNTDGSCACGEITPIEETSWGRVKALYN